MSTYQNQFNLIKSLIYRSHNLKVNPINNVDTGKPYIRFSEEVLYSHFLLLSILSNSLCRIKFLLICLTQRYFTFSFHFIICIVKT